MEALFYNRPRQYRDFLEQQEELLKARIADEVGDTVLFLEHEPVVTAGRRLRAEHLLVSPEYLNAQGVDFFQTSRGGDLTFHGPGQLVMYPIMKLGQAQADAHSYLNSLEEIAIRTAADFGVTAYRRAGMNGAWTDAGKIAAIGFHLRRWVTSHGISFNIAPDLRGFSLIVPCGLHGEKVASLKAVLGEACPSVADVRERMLSHFSNVCGRKLVVRVVA